MKPPSEACGSELCKSLTLGRRGSDTQPLLNMGGGLTCASLYCDLTASSHICIFMRKDCYRNRLTNLTQPKRAGTRTRAGKNSVPPRKEETWLVQLIKRVTSSCHLALDDSGAAQYRSGLIMSSTHWDEFMCDEFMTESLRVSNSLNILPPECAGHGLPAVNWIRDILRAYVTTLEEHSQCQELTRGDEQLNTLIKNTLEFITGTLAHSGFLGSNSELNQLILSEEEFK